VYVVDTNVLVYAADQDSPFHAKCYDFLQASRIETTAWYITWGICYEFLRVTTHPRVFRKPWSAAHAWSFVEAVLASPALGVLTATDRHAAVAAKVVEEIPYLSGNLMYDAQTAILMREHGIRTIYTRDADFHRFPFLEPLDPVV
jgi:toxin-antitoxin system PIN domain toxin